MVLATIVLAAEAVGSEMAGAAEEVNNPILPTVNEMFWGAVAFFVLWMLMKYALLPPIQRGIEERAQKIREDQAAAEAAKVQADQAFEEYEASLVTTKAEALRITEDARAKADEDRREKLAVAEAGAAEVRAQAAAEVAQAKVAAKQQLTPAITTIAVSAAEAVVGRPFDVAEQTRVIEDYVNRAGSQN